MDTVTVKNVTKHFILHHEKKNTLYDHLFSRKKFSEKIFALKNVSFSLKQGECLGVIGRNGSGKSTLLKIIAGILQPSSGSVHTEGSIAPIIELGIGFQPDFTGKENIYLYGSILGIPQKEIDSKYSDIVRFSELENFIDTPISKYSTGMQSKLAFATAILCSPDILLIDEILNVGDMSFQRKSIAKILDFKKQGKSIILVSHAMKDIAAVCDRCILLEKGSIICIDSKDSAIHRYVQLICSEDKKKVTAEIDIKIKQIDDLHLQARQTHVREAKSCMQHKIDEYEKECAELFSDLRKIENILHSETEIHIQKLLFEQKNLKMDYARKGVTKNKFNKNHIRLSKSIKQLKQEKARILQHLKDAMFSEIKCLGSEKLPVLRELKKLIFWEIENNGRRSIHDSEIARLQRVIIQELSQNYPNEVRQKFKKELHGMQTDLNKIS
jgi:ABC-type polysaccharide/polyol phosphate transport system ATPase subunit